VDLGPRCHSPRVGFPRVATVTSSNLQPYVSIVIPTRNGMPLVTRCLLGVLSQVTPWPFEVIVIDSDSSDGTWQFLETLPIRRLRIRKAEFNHGGTRTYAASRAQGDFLVFLVQDAIPVDECWLANLVAAFEGNPSAAGAYSRQIARPESNPITHFLSLDSTPSEQAPAVKALPPDTTLASLHPQEQFALALFQNNSSCIRRSVWMEHQFAPVPYGEDIDWGKRVIEAGYAIAYAPSSAVYHSHDRSPLYTLKRSYADHFQATQLFGFVMIPSIRRALRLAVAETLSASRYISRCDIGLGVRIRYMLLAPLFIAALITGHYLGSHTFQYLRRYPWLAHLDAFLRVGV
jgi:rhamnosyltransferase